jgi:pyruvate dehydrogenase E1 component alpha subunit
MLKSLFSRRTPQLNARVLSRAFSADTHTFDMSRGFKGHNLDVPTEMTVECTKAELLDYYRQMVYFRRFEIVCDTLYKQRQIRGFCHLYDGQEAVVVGMEAGLIKGDSIITSYREHCHQITRGDSGDRVMAELLGKAGGCSGGKGGSMHLYYPQNNFYGGNGIVGAQVPLGAGVAFAHKYRGENNLCVAAYGDGAANQGQIFEAANMAKLWGLPMIFMIENNEYGMGTSTKRASASDKFYTRGDYIPGIWIDGMDVLAVKKGFEFAGNYIRENQTPLFVEVSTYRYHGHSMSDPGISYRSREEVTAVKESRDCIDGVKQRLLEAGWITPAEIKAITKEVRAEVDGNVKFAQESPLPDLAKLTQNIYIEEYEPRLVRHGF